MRHHCTSAGRRLPGHRAARHLPPRFGDAARPGFDGPVPNAAHADGAERDSSGGVGEEGRAGDLPATDWRCAAQWRARLGLVDPRDSADLHLTLQSRRSARAGLQGILQLPWLDHHPPGERLACFADGAVDARYATANGLTFRLMNEAGSACSGRWLESAHQPVAA